MISQQSFYKPLIAGFCLIISLFALSGIVTYYEVNALGDLTSTIYKHPLEVSNASLKASMGVVSIHRTMKDVVLADEKDVEKFVKKVDSEEARVFKNLNIVKEKILGTSGQKLEAETRKLFIDWKLIRDEVIGLVRKGKRRKAAGITTGKGANHVILLENKMLSLKNYARNKADNFFQSASKVRRRVSFTTSAITASGIILSLLIIYIVLKQILYSYNLVNMAEKEREKVISDLTAALEEIKTLKGIIPICSYCKQIRNDDGFWQQVEQYVLEHTDAQFTHGICPECEIKIYSEMDEK